MIEDIISSTAEPYIRSPPWENASTAILKKLGLNFVARLKRPEAREVWE
ncbi:hypothetical protein [Methanosarcina sp.]